MPVNEPSWRKPAGTFLILLIIAVWAVIVTSLSGWIGALPILVQTIIYVVAGFVWIFPARRVLVWMELGRWRI